MFENQMFEVYLPRAEEPRSSENSKPVWFTLKKLFSFIRPVLMSDIITRFQKDHLFRDIGYMISNTL